LTVKITGDVHITNFTDTAKGNLEVLGVDVRRDVPDEEGYTGRAIVATVVSSSATATASSTTMGRGEVTRKAMGMRWGWSMAKVSGRRRTVVTIVPAYVMTRNKESVSLGKRKKKTHN
jgi:hypothetical protein